MTISLAQVVHWEAVVMFSMQHMQQHLAQTAGCIDHSALPSEGDNTLPSNTKAILYFDVNKNNNNILDVGEHANLLIMYKSGDRPAQLDNIKAEIIVPTGSALTVERQVPAITTTNVDLG